MSQLTAREEGGRGEWARRREWQRSQAAPGGQVKPLGGASLLPPRAELPWGVGGGADLAPGKIKPEACTLP